MQVSQLSKLNSYPVLHDDFKAFDIPEEVGRKANSFLQATKDLTSASVTGPKQTL